MKNEDNRDSASTDAQTQSPSQSPVTPPAPQQNEMRANSERRADIQENVTEKLERDIKSGEIWLIAINALLLIANIVIASIYYGQLKQMRKATKATETTAQAAVGNAKTAKDTLDEMKKGSTDTHQLAVNADIQAKQAIEQARGIKELAKQAGRNADVAIRSLEMQERPWVGLQGINIKEDVIAEKDIPVTAIIANYGKTPATHTESLIGANAYCTPFPENPQYLSSGGAPSSVLLLPQIPIETSEIKMHLTPEWLIRLSSNLSQCRLYVYGTVTYCDVFNRSHFRHFCGYWNAGTKRNFLGCSTYNDGDEDQPDKPPQVCKK